MTYEDNLKIVETLKVQIEQEHGVIINLEYRKTRTRSGKMYHPRKDEPNNYRVICPQPHNSHALHVCFHELGHVVLHRTQKREYSCLNEYRADMYAFEQFERLGIEASLYTHKHHRWYMAYSLGQALNRGMRKKNIPSELKPYLKYLRKLPYYDYSGYAYRAKPIREIRVKV